MSGSKKEVNYSKQKMKSRIAWIIATIFAVFWLLVALVPFVFMILNSLRKQFDMLSQGVFHLPDPWYFENYPNICANGIFRMIFLRSVIIVTVSLILDCLIISAICGISAVQNEVPVPRGYFMPESWQ
mgnify:CR=1 FL=1